ncbi:MAG: amidohydrolase family protein [Streptosporangiaceae bacterium]
MLPWIAAQSLTDHHCHGVLRDGVSAGDIVSLLDEGAGTLDSLAGFSFMRWCPPVLDLPPGVSLASYVARRAELGVPEVVRRFLGQAWLGAMFVDTGFHGDRLFSPEEMGELAGATAREVLRLEALASTVVSSGVTAAGFADAYRSALSAATRRGGTAGAPVVAVKSIAAYRVGLDLSPARPDDRDVARAADRWLSAGAGRLADETLHRFFIWAAAELGLPVQFHVGYGDRDVDLHRCDPLLLTPLLRALEPTGSPIMLLHNYPFHRHAGYLAQVFPLVYADLGLATHNVGRQSAALLAEALELVPFGKFLFSSDAFGLPELYYLGALHFRRGLSAFLSAGLTDGDWTETDAERITRLICTENAQRAYRLGS